MQVYAEEMEGAAVVNKADWVTAICVTRDGGRVVFGYANGEIRVFSPRSWEQVAPTVSASKSTGMIVAIVVSPDDRHIITSSIDGKVIVWFLPTMTKVRRLSGNSKPVYCLAVTPDGFHVVGGGEERVVYVWSIGDHDEDGDGDGDAVIMGGEGDDTRRHEGEILCIAVSPDGKQVVSGGFDDKIIVWSLDTNEATRCLNTVGEMVFALAVSPDGERIVCGGPGGKLHVFSLGIHDDAPLSTIYTGTSSIECISLSPDGDYVATGLDNGIVKVWRLSDRCMVDSIRVDFASVSSVAMLPDGKSLVAGGVSGKSHRRVFSFME